MERIPGSHPAANYPQDREGDVDAGGGGQGQLELAGGTGVYVGLAGRCTYETEYLANNQVITTTDCSWHRE